MKIAKILHPTDFSNGSKAAMDYVKSLAKQHNAEITLMYVVDEVSRTQGWYVPHISLNELYKDMEASARKELERCCYEELRDFGKVEKVVLKGVPEDEIIRYAEEKAVDLIVLGTHSRGGGMEFVFGSTAEKVMRKARCSVLCVKTPTGQTP